jgi:integrase
LLCFAGGLRRSELVALDHADLSFTSDGLILKIRQSKADQEGEGAIVRIAKGSYPHTCPVRAMEIWLKRSNIRMGPVFPQITGGGS